MGHGLRNRDFYCLIGVRVGNGDGAVQHGICADDDEGKKRIWAAERAIVAADTDPR